MIDLHFHLLPGLDDGPEDLTAAVGLARAAVAAGTSTVVATPHVSWRWPENDALRIADGVLLLNRALRTAGVDLEVRRGAEVALTHAADLPSDELGRLGLGGGPWLLLECPTAGSAASLSTLVGSVVGSGHRVLLAHPERIPAFRREPRALIRLVAEGARCQVTASALSGDFGKQVRRFSRWMLDERLVHVMASDAHGVNGRPPALAETLARAGLSPADAQRLGHEAPAAVLAGADLAVG